MSLNTAALQTQLETRLASLVGTETSEQVLALTAAMDNLTQNRFISVVYYADLPNLSTNQIPSGTLVFVQQINTFLMAVGTQWRGVDGRVYTPQSLGFSWGVNVSAQLGDGTKTDRQTPVSILNNITNWIQLDGGLQHSLGLTSTGIAYAWGLGSYGELGNGTAGISASALSPVSVIGGITNWVQISAGRIHNLGLTSTGIAYAWGYNLQGQLGDNTTSSRLSPVTVIGGITNWSQMSGGNAHSLGLTSTGIVYAWGRNSDGQLGDNTISNRSSPVTVVGGITSWSRVSAGYRYSLVQTSAGVAYAWGNNSSGSLGDNTIIGKASPVTVVGNITTWSDLTAGGAHSLGLTSTGIAYAWGFNGQGQVGDNTIVSKRSPVTVIGGITNWSQLSAGPDNTSNHSLGLTSAGIAYAWGAGGSGRLGDGNITNRSSPVTVIGGFTTWSQVSAGATHSLAIFAT